MRQIVLVIHNIRSAHNVGSLLRTADGLGIEKVLISGYSPYPKMSADNRLPHIADKVNLQIHKTALGAENYVKWHKTNNIEIELASLKKAGYALAALEQIDKSMLLDKYQPPAKIALIVGNEVDGLDTNLLSLMDIWLEIPMQGHKESFNVAVAGAIGLYHLITA